MTLNSLQIVVIVLMVTAGTQITRITPFIIFRNHTSDNKLLNYLGMVLPYAAIGFLVVYCLKGTDINAPNYGLSEIISILVITIIHYKYNNVLLSIGLGTILYMLLVQNIFI